MTVIIRNTDLINTSITQDVFSNSGTHSVTVGTGDELVIATDVFIGAGGSIVDINEIQDFDLTFLGSAFTLSTALRMDVNTTATTDYSVRYRVVIGEDASIVSRSIIGFFGVLNTASGILDAGSHADFNNAGSLTTAVSSGLTFQTLAVVNVVNSGTIGADTSATVGFRNVTTASLINTGLITSTNALDTNYDQAAVAMRFAVENAYFINSGSVVSLAQAYGSDATVSEYVGNSGSFLGDVLMSNRIGGELRNSGNIEGDVFTQDGDDIVINTGLIDGTLELGDDDDYYQATADGVVTGAIAAGTGQDTVIGADANDSIDGGTGDDVLRGNGGGDTITGDAGDDTIAGGDGDDDIMGGDDDDYIGGGAGDDTIDGGSGNEDIFGGAGDDTIIGGTGTDNLRGNAGSDSISGGDDLDLLRGGDGNDTLEGGGGNDTLNGGNGNDDITAGLGKDVMRGNGGNDVFIFVNALDSTTSDVDRIRDFQSGQDLIDLSAIETFSFVSSSAFSGTGAEVRFQTTGSGLRIEMDVDGDGSADMRVNMNNVSVLTSEDFIL